MMVQDDSKMVTKVITVHPEVPHDIYPADAEIFYWKLLSLYDKLMQNWQSIQRSVIN